MKNLTCDGCDKHTSPLKQVGVTTEEKSRRGRVKKRHVKRWLCSACRADLRKQKGVA